MQQILITNRLYPVFAVRHPVDCILYSIICPLPSTSVENPLQISPFKENKPNFQDAQMNVSFILTKNCENISDWTLGENKPNPSGLRCLLKNCRTDQTQFLYQELHGSFIITGPEKKSRYINPLPLEREK